MIDMLCNFQLVLEPDVDEKNHISFPLSPTKDCSILDEVNSFINSSYKGFSCY